MQSPRPTAIAVRSDAILSLTTTVRRGMTTAIEWCISIPVERLRAREKRNKRPDEALFFRSRMFAIPHEKHRSQCPFGHRGAPPSSQKMVLIPSLQVANPGVVAYSSLKNATFLHNHPPTWAPSTARTKSQSILPVGELVMVPARGAQSPGFDSEQVALFPPLPYAHF